MRGGDSIGLLAVCGIDAAAQAPVVSYQQSGSRVRIEWNGVAGATAYDLVVTGTINGQITVPTTFIDVVPPAGTYTVRVRGIAPGVVGPLSAPTTIIVGGACAAPPAPTINSVTTNGNVLTLNWTAVAGTVGYRVQLSRAPDATEYQKDMAASQTSFVMGIPIAGTFYVRVVSGSACGALAISGERSFTIDGTTPISGPRTPDPAPGQLLPLPDYAHNLVMEAARRFAGPLSRACKTNNEYLFLLLQELRRFDTRWGLNWKRGDRNQGLSSDIVSYNPTALPDDGNGRVYLFDVVGAECEANTPSFNNVTAATWAAQGNPACAAGTYCTRWTLEPYIAAGFDHSRPW